jgi:hypothetical protein
MEDAEISRLLQNMPPPIDVSEIIREQLAASEEMNSVPNSTKTRKDYGHADRPLKKLSKLLYLIQ